MEKICERFTSSSESLFAVRNIRANNTIVSPALRRDLSCLLCTRLARMRSEMAGKRCLRMEIRMPRLPHTIRDGKRTIVRLSTKITKKRSDCSSSSRLDAKVLLSPSVLLPRVAELRLLLPRGLSVAVRGLHMSHLWRGLIVLWWSHMGPTVSIRG